MKLKLLIEEISHPILQIIPISIEKTQVVSFFSITVIWDYTPYFNPTSWNFFSLEIQNLINW